MEFYFQEIKSMKLKHSNLNYFYCPCCSLVVHFKLKKNCSESKTVYFEWMLKSDAMVVFDLW